MSHLYRTVVQKDGETEWRFADDVMFETVKEAQEYKRPKDEPKSKFRIVSVSCEAEHKDHDKHK